MEQLENEASTPLLGTAQLVVQMEFKRRLAYAIDNYRFWAKAFASWPTVNQSMNQLKKCARRAPERLHEVPLNLELETAIAVRANIDSTGILGQRSSDKMAAARKEIIQQIKPIRGRPDARLLRHHVQGVMVLWGWATGVPVTASPTTGVHYKPQMTSIGAKFIEQIFQSIDPSITTTTLMNIVRNTRQKRELEGKTYEDFFPGYCMRVVPH